MIKRRRYTPWCRDWLISAKNIRKIGLRRRKFMLRKSRKESLRKEKKERLSKRNLRKRDTRRVVAEKPMVKIKTIEFN